MPVKKSAFKSMRQSQKRHQRNLPVISELKGRVKKTNRLIASGEKEQAMAEAKALVSSLDKAVSKGIIRKNTASQKKSKLARRLKKLSA